MDAMTVACAQGEGFEWRQPGSRKHYRIDSYSQSMLVQVWAAMSLEVRVKAEARFGTDINRFAVLAWSAVGGQRRAS